MLRLLVIQEKMESGVTEANAAGLVQAEGTVQSGDIEITAQQRQEPRVVSSSYRLLRRLETNV